MLLQEYRSSGENQELKSRNLLILQFIKPYIRLNNIVVSMVVSYEDGNISIIHTNNHNLCTEINNTLLTPTDIL